MSDEDKDKTLSKKKRGRISKHREQIRKLHDADYTQKEIQNETGASQSAVSKELKKYREEDPQKYYKVFSSEEESKALRKTEPIEEPLKSIHIKEKPLSISVEKTRVQARNRVYPQKKKLKPPKIKLMLDNDKHFKDNVRHILNNYSIWDLYNILEIRKYISDFEDNLNSGHEWLENAKTPQGYHHPTNYYRLVTKKEIFAIMGYEYKSYEWTTNLSKIVSLWEISRARRGLLKENLTTKEWYEKMEIEFPEPLEPEANWRIHNRADLERTGIFEDLEYKIKDELKIDDELEYYYHTNEKLTPLDIIRIKLLKRENPNHPYSVLLKEKIQDNENRGI